MIIPAYKSTCEWRSNLTMSLSHERICSTVLSGLSVQPRLSISLCMSTALSKSKRVDVTFIRDLLNSQKIC